LAGTVWGLWIAARNLALDRLERENVTAIFAIAFFLLMFLPIPFVRGGVIFGYWTPRLILPALLYFFWAAFLLLDRKLAFNRRAVRGTVSFLVLIQCAIEIAVLV
jgi:hypothetical protein